MREISSLMITLFLKEHTIIRDFYEMPRWFGYFTSITLYSDSWNHRLLTIFVINGWQLAKMKKSIPDMSLP